MPIVTTDRLRNIVLLSHSGAGKTILYRVSVGGLQGRDADASATPITSVTESAGVFALAAHSLRTKC